jgi:hypothetical protein
MAARCRGQIVEIAQGHVLAPSGLEQHAREGAAALARRRRGHRPVKRITRDVVADPAADQDRGVVGVNQLCNRESLSFAAASLLPMIGITPGRTASASGARAYLLSRLFRSA